jgi:hypothetical protein
MDVMTRALEALPPAQIDRGMGRLIADLGLLDLALGGPAPAADPPLARAA